MVDTEINWVNFTGRVDVIHPLFDVTIYATNGRIDRTSPKSKAFPAGSFLKTVKDWYTRHKDLSWRFEYPEGPVKYAGLGRAHRIGRDKWSEGPWLEEPDFRVWSSNELPCVISRNGVGAWAGYVGVSRGHKYYQVGYDEIKDVRAHGGLTYSGVTNGLIRRAYNAIYAKPSSRLWWLGFDCAHSFNTVPHKLMADLKNDVESYVTYDQAIGLTEDLAEQLANSAKKGVVWLCPSV